MILRAQACHKREKRYEMPCSHPHKSYHHITSTNQNNVDCLHLNVTSSNIRSFSITTNAMTLVRSFLTKTFSPAVAARALSGRVADRGILFSAACPMDYQEELASTPIDTSSVFVEKGLLFSLPCSDVDRNTNDDAETGNTSSFAGFFNAFKL